jgi:hypothetical protein
MKTKFYWVALLASAAMIAQANAGGHHGGGGGGAGAQHFSAPTAFTGSAGPAFHSMPARNFNGKRAIYSGWSFYGRQRYNFDSVNSGNAIARWGANSPFAVSGNEVAGNHRNRVGRVQNGNSLPSNWRNHVVAQHSNNWHRDWDRHTDHWWHGRRCHFINGSWVIFDAGFYPWWSYGYPYGYGYEYYPYYSDYYGPEAYEAQMYDGNNHEADIDSTVAAAQRELKRAGYYGGKIDGILGAQTRQAIANYQDNHGQPATGHLTTTTLQALGLGRVAND